MAEHVIEREVGSEWDAALLAGLRDAVSELGGTMEEALTGVGGSQELAVYEIRIGGATLTATAETYMGLRLRGPESVVARLEGLLRG